MSASHPASRSTIPDFSDFHLDLECFSSSATSARCSTSSSRPDSFVLRTPSHPFVYEAFPPRPFTSHGEYGSLSDLHEYTHSTSSHPNSLSSIDETGFVAPFGFHRRDTSLRDSRWPRTSPLRNQLDSKYSSSGSPMYIPNQGPYSCYAPDVPLPNSSSYQPSYSDHPKLPNIGLRETMHEPVWDALMKSVLDTSHVHDHDHDDVISSDSHNPAESQQNWTQHGIPTSSMNHGTSVSSDRITEASLRWNAPVNGVQVMSSSKRLTSRFEEDLPLDSSIGSPHTASQSFPSVYSASTLPHVANSVGHQKGKGDCELNNRSALGKKLESGGRTGKKGWKGLTGRISKIKLMFLNARGRV